MSNLEPLIVTGELIFLTAEERIRFYVQVCKSMGLNPLTRPLQYFEQIDRNGKRNLILYALRGACVQLSKNHNLTTSLSKAEFAQNAVMFSATVRNPQGREDSAVGAVSMNGLAGKEYADAIMAAQTKAKRRAVLDFTGSGLLDESEVEGMRGSTIEVTEADLKDYVPIVAAPAPASSEAPATEVLAETVERVQTTPFPPEVYHSIKPEILQTGLELTQRLAESMRPLWDIVANEKYELAVDALGPDMAKGATVNMHVQVPEQPTETEITSRLNSYRRDTLQTGGMRPSKGFGIAAKWAKFLAKHAPAKSMEQYLAVLNKLDSTFKEKGANGVVVFIEAEIAV